MKLDVYTTDGGKSKKKDFDIPAIEGNKGLHALKQVILAYQANQRQGSASTKTRAEVKGSGKKPWRQKGTGLARAGSRRSPDLARRGHYFRTPSARLQPANK